VPDLLNQGNTVTDPMSRAHAREAAGLRKLRKGRSQCEATRRDGERCQAPAIAGGTVCRRHGGGASQVRINARHIQLLEARYTAYEAWAAARGTPGEFDALCATSRADNAVWRYEVKLERLRELRAQVRQLKAVTA
jgi:hypothetical protein